MKQRQYSFKPTVYLLLLDSLEKCEHTRLHYVPLADVQLQILFLVTCLYLLLTSLLPSFFRLSALDLLICAGVWSLGDWFRLVALRWLTRESRWPPLSFGCSGSVSSQDCWKNPVRSFLQVAIDVAVASCK